MWRQKILILFFLRGNFGDCFSDKLGTLWQKFSIFKFFFGILVKFFTKKKCLFVYIFQIDDLDLKSKYYN